MITDEYRKKCAKLCYDSAQETATETHIWRSVDRNRGSFMTIPELLISFGGTHPSLPTFNMAVEHAATYARACINMKSDRHASHLHPHLLELSSPSSVFAFFSR